MVSRERDNERESHWRWKKQTKQIQMHSFSKSSWSPQRRHGYQWLGWLTLDTQREEVKNPKSWARR